MLFYFLLFPLAVALTMFIIRSDIDVIYKEMLVFVPIPAVLAGIVDEALATRAATKKRNENDE